jgi:hypothetical protein
MNVVLHLLLLIAPEYAIVPADAPVLRAMAARILVSKIRLGPAYRAAASVTADVCRGSVQTFMPENPAAVSISSIVPVLNL